MKKILAFLLFVTILFTVNALAESIEITSENFEEYFAVSIDVSNSRMEKSFSFYGMDSYNACGDVSITIDAKYPCDINDVSFSVKVPGGAKYGALVTNETNITFSGTMPQSGSYTSKKSVEIDVGAMGAIYDGIRFNDWQKKIISASGSITMKSDDSSFQDNNSNMVADEIAKLGELLDKGLITQDEFDSQKAKLLGN